MTKKRVLHSIRTLTALFLMLCMTVTSLWNVRAESGNLKITHGTICYFDIIYDPDSQRKLNCRGVIDLMQWNGQDAYCLQIDRKYSRGTYTEDGELETYEKIKGLDQAKRDRINAIAHYGSLYRYTGKYYYEAAQLLIWEQMIGKVVALTDGVDLTQQMDMLNRLVDACLKKHRVVIHACLERDGSSLADGASVQIGDQIVIHIDSKNLARLNIDLQGNALQLVSRDETKQEIRLRVKEAGSGTVTFQLQTKDPIKGTPLVLRSGDFQAVTTAGSLFGGTAKISFQGCGAPALIEKTDLQGVPVKGAHLTIDPAPLEGEDHWISDGSAHRIPGLRPGETYTIRETQAPAGYVQASPVRFTMPSGPSEEPFRYQMKDAKVTVVKQDRESGNRPAGDASLANAEFTVYDVISGKEIYTDSWTQSDPGQPHAVSNLKEGDSYILRETKAPAGYHRADDLSFKVNDSLHDLSLTVKDEVMHGSYVITKVVGGPEETEERQRMEEGAGFTAILRSFADQNHHGSVSSAEFDAASAALQKDPSLLRRDEWAHGTSDGSGRLRLEHLAYGEYALRQTEKTDPEAVILPDILTFRISSGTDGKDPADQYERIRDDLMHYHLKLIKKDAGTGKTVISDPAWFRIFYDADGNGRRDEAETKDSRKLEKNLSLQDGMLVFETDDGHTYDTFATGQAVGLPDHVYSDQNVGKGTMALPDALPSGNYIVIETKAPAGYAKAADLPVALHYASSISSQEQEASSLDTLTREVLDQPLHGRLVIHKNITDRADTDRKADHTVDFTEIRFSLKAAEDIIDPADGSVITRKGEPAGILVHNAYTACGNNGIFALNQNGTVTVDGLPAGSYQLEEIETDPGLTRNRAVIPVSLHVDPERAVIEDVDLHIDNQPTSILIRKKDGEGRPVTGAEMTLYELSSKDPVEIRKDASGEPLVIDTWTTDEKAEHRITGLLRGTSYLLKETGTPSGHVTARDLIIEPQDTENEQVRDVIDDRVLISKRDMGGKELAGASMSILDASDQKVIDHWISDGKPHAAEHLKADGSYILREEAAPAGYVLANAFPFDLKEGKVSRTIVMQDQMFRALKTDPEGRAVHGAQLTVTDEEGKTVDTWVTGQKVLALEENERNQLRQGIPVEKTGNAGSTILIKAEDAEQGLYLVRITYPDGSAETSEIDEEGREQAHLIRNLEAGKIYTLQETDVPGGYLKADSITFTPSEEADSDITLTMIDEKKIPKRLPNTADRQNLLVDLAGMCSALIVLFCIILIHRLQDQSF